MVWGGSVVVSRDSSRRRRVRGMRVVRSLRARTAAGRGGSRATAAAPATLARNLRPRATSNHLLIEYSSNSGNISRHFASHAAAASYLR